MIVRLRQSLTVASLVVTAVVSSSRTADAQIMFRGFAALSQATCLNNAGTAEKREVLTGGDFGFHTKMLELSFGGVFTSCSDFKTLGNFGAILFPIHTRRVYAGGGFHWDFNDPSQGGFIRPEAVIGFILKDSKTNTHDRSGNLIRQDIEGWTIDARVGRYQARTLYVAVGVVYYFSVWWQQ